MPHCVVNYFDFSVKQIDPQIWHMFHYFQIFPPKQSFSLMKMYYTYSIILLLMNVLLVSIFLNLCISLFNLFCAILRVTVAVSCPFIPSYFHFHLQRTSFSYLTTVNKKSTGICSNPLAFHSLSYIDIFKECI